MATPVAHKNISWTMFLLVKNIIVYYIIVHSHWDFGNEIVITSVMNAAEENFMLPWTA